MNIMTKCYISSGKIFPFFFLGGGQLPPASCPQPQPSPTPTIKMILLRHT